MKTAHVAALLAGALAACASQRPVPAPPAPAPCVERATRSGFPVATPDEAGLHADALRTLLTHARASGSHAVVIVRDGRLAVEEYFGGRPHPICAMSVSKSVAQLAVGVMVREVRANLDERMSRTFRAWRDDRRKDKVTLRHLLTHTSGLDVTRAAWWRGETTEQTLTRAPMHHEPGMDFRYNNAAVDFVSVFVHARMRMHLDDLLQREVFGPIGVRGAHWAKDPAGHPMAAGELFIEPVELAKVGQLMLQDGVWEGRRILPPGWVARSTEPGQPFTESCGLLWWLHAPRRWALRDDLLASWDEAGVPMAVQTRVRPLVGRPFDSADSLTRARDALLTPDQRRELPRALRRQRVESARVTLTGPVDAYYANGWVGQWVVVVPSRRIVAVRMRDASPQDRNDSSAHEYGRFLDDVLAL